MQSRVWPWGNGVTRLEKPPGPRCNLWFLVLHLCSIIQQGQALWLQLPGPTCFWESWVDVWGTGLLQWDAELQTSPLTQPKSGYPLARHPWHGIPGTAISRRRAPELGSRARMMHLWPICKKPPHRTPSAPLASPRPPSPPGGMSPPAAVPRAHPATAQHESPL